MTEKIIYSDFYTFDEWCEDMKADADNEQELTHDNYNDYMQIWYGDERMNLNKEVDGVIVAFAVLGLWNGSPNGAKVCGTNVNSIMSSGEDYNKWYCDRYNVRSEQTHHDGTNKIWYRVAKDKKAAERLVNKIAYKGMTLQQFYRATKSLRPYVANIFGW